MSASILHSIIGDGYYLLTDEELAIELEGAEIAEENAVFEVFTLIAGYRDRAFSADRKMADPFICIRNSLSNGPHLFICQEGDQ